VSFLVIALRTLVIVVLICHPIRFILLDILNFINTFFPMQILNRYNHRLYNFPSSFYPICIPQNILPHPLLFYHNCLYHLLMTLIWYVIVLLLYLHLLFLLLMRVQVLFDFFLCTWLSYFTGHLMVCVLVCVKIKHLPTILCCVEFPTISTCFNILISDIHYWYVIAWTKLGGWSFKIFSSTSLELCYPMLTSHDSSPMTA